MISRTGFESLVDTEGVSGSQNGKTYEVDFG